MESAKTFDTVERAVFFNKLKKKRGLNDQRS